ncbi:MAG: Na+/H+ antiporter NhaC family protein, partial [Pirellulaceae bacterium]
MPPVVAIVMAIATRRVVVSLLIGLVVGALIWKGSPLAAIGGLTFMLRDSLAVYDDVEKAWDIGHIKVLLFTLMMGAMVGTVHRNGGMAAVARGVANWASNRRRGQLATWGLGLIIFIDDYANSLLLGHTMRPVTDRLKISREKLAYLVDSTAAPVAGLALISTWVAGEISYIRDGLAGVTFAEGTAVDAFQLFMLSIPTRFYVLWALLFVPIVAWLQRDFGPMLAAERRAATASDKPLEKDSAAADMPMG